MPLFESFGKLSLSLFSLLGRFLFGFLLVNFFSAFLHLRVHWKIEWKECSKVNHFLLRPGLRTISEWFLSGTEAFSFSNSHNGTLLLLRKRTVFYHWFLALRRLKTRSPRRPIRGVCVLNSWTSKSSSREKSFSLSLTDLLSPTLVFKLIYTTTLFKPIDCHEGANFSKVRDARARDQKAFLSFSPFVLCNCNKHWKNQQSKIFKLLRKKLKPFFFLWSFSAPLKLTLSLSLTDHFFLPLPTTNLELAHSISPHLTWLHYQCLSTSVGRCRKHMFHFFLSFHMSICSRTFILRFGLSALSLPHTH